MKRRSSWKNAPDQVHFYGRTAFFKKEAAFEKYNKKKKYITIKMNSTSKKKYEKCRNINKIKECWCDR